MPNKELGPLPKAQRDGVVLKKKVDSFIKESEKSIKNTKLKDRDIKLKELYERCVEAQEEVTELLETVRALKEDEEPKPIKGFEGKKNDEIKRLEQFQTKLQATVDKFPDDVKPRPVVEEGKAEEEEEGGEEEEDLDDEEEEEEEEDVEDEEDLEDESEEEEDEEEEDTVPAPVVQSAIHEKQPVKTSTSKPVKGGEEEESEEEEEESEEEEEEESEEDEEEEAEDGEEEEDDEGEEEEEDLKVSSTMRLFEAICDYEAVEPEDLGFKKGDVLTIFNTREDGWWEATNDKGEKGVVPKTYLKLYNKYKDLQDQGGEEEDEDEPLTPKGKRSGKELWKGIKTVLQETSVSDVLHAMGAVPSGFRPTTLGQKFSEDNYRMKHHLIPKLSTSNVTFRDLFLDPAKNMIRPRPTWIQKTISLVTCRQIPPPGAGLEVLDRHVRVCLFDGENILSNIHCIRVASVDKTQRTWNFSTRFADNIDTFQHAEFFVRTTHNMPNLGILLELCICYQRTSTGEKGELSCGWAHLPLVDQSGGSLVNKAYDLYVNGGTPYEQGVEVDPSISRRAASHALMTLVSGNKQPRLVARVKMPEDEVKKFMETLPDTLVGNICWLSFCSYYRQLLADSLLRDRLDLESTEPIYSPILMDFPKVADQHDIMNYLRTAWVERVKPMKRIERRDEEHMKELFRKVFMETIYPLCHSASLPTYKSGDLDNYQERDLVIGQFRASRQDHGSVLAALCSQDFTFTPFESSEASFSVIGPHCLLHRPIHVKAM